jgi:hypothetical protein
MGPSQSPLYTFSLFFSIESAKVTVWNSVNGASFEQRRGPLGTPKQSGTTLLSEFIFMTMKNDDFHFLNVSGLPPTSRMTMTTRYVLHKSNNP